MLKIEKGFVVQIDHTYFDDLCRVGYVKNEHLDDDYNVIVNDKKYPMELSFGVPAKTESKAYDHLIHQTRYNVERTLNKEYDTSNTMFCLIKDSVVIQPLHFNGDQYYIAYMPIIMVKGE